METIAERVPVEVFPPGESIEEEMTARGWTPEDIARRMGGARDYAVNLLTVQMLIAVHDTNLILDEETARGLGVAFGVSPQYFLNLDATWRRYGPPSRYATAH